ncbi:ECF-type sigma factor [Rubripirellula obstinata]|uniref:ECF-type sigma factor n=1 Tax=Rubripirellula obstinata TaxID=406547 RepID=UPI00135CA59F|nr:ECF-type sigma factor [Rubripirellula obstinata]
MNQSPRSITLLLHEMATGQGDVEKLYERVRFQFHRIAENLMRGRPPHEAPPSTAIADDIFLDMIDLGEFHWENRRAFFAYAATAMRRRIANHFRDANRIKRGGDFQQQPLTGNILVDARSDIPEQMVEVSDLLDSLHEKHPLAIEALDHWAFGNWTFEEIAGMMDKTEHQVEYLVRIGKKIAERAIREANH